MRFVISSFTVFVLLIAANPAMAANFDASGTWTYVETHVTDSCDPAVADTGTAVITQNGDNFTLQIDNGEAYTGTISGATYTASGGDNETSTTITFTLSSETAGSGGYDWEWTDGSLSCFGSTDFTLTKVQSNDPGDETPDYSGTFKYVTSNVWDGCPEKDLATETGTIVIKVYNDNTFDITIGDRECSGTYSDNVFTYTDSFEVNGGIVNQQTTMTMTSENAGTGTTNWTWNDFCSGGFDITATRVEKSSGGGGGGGCFIDSIR